MSELGSAKLVMNFLVPGTYICWEPHPKGSHTDKVRK